MTFYSKWVDSGLVCKICYAPFPDQKETHEQRICDHCLKEMENEIDADKDNRDNRRAQ